MQPIYRILVSDKTGAEKDWWLDYQKRPFSDRKFNAMKADKELTKKSIIQYFEVTKSGKHENLNLIASTEKVAHSKAA